MAGAIASGTLKGALSGVFSGAAFGAIGGSFKEYGIENTGTQMTVHAASGGIISDVQDSNFGHGFVTAGIMKGKVNTNNSPSRVFLQALAGGTVSKITGGKFVNGAVTSAIKFVANELKNY